MSVAVTLGHTITLWALRLQETRFEWDGRLVLGLRWQGGARIGTSLMLTDVTDWSSFHDHEGGKILLH